MRPGLGGQPGALLLPETRLRGTNWNAEETFEEAGPLHDAVATSLSGVRFSGDYYASAEYRAERLAMLLEQTITGLAG